MTTTTFHTASIGNTEVFYREAGPKDAPALLLLHGFPSSSHMYRNLIPALADRYRVVAPDLPGFGFSDAPDRAAFRYTFESLTNVIERFTDAVGLRRYALFVFDYGAPIGFRLAVRDPQRVTAIISQNGNAYAEGLSEGWNPIRRYWEAPTAQNRAALEAFMTPETTAWQYTHGVADGALAGKPHARQRVAGPARHRGDPARSFPRLREQRRTLPNLPALFPAAPAG